MPAGRSRLEVAAQSQAATMMVVAVELHPQLLTSCPWESWRKAGPPATHWL